MDLPWLETASALMVYVYAAIVAIGVAASVVLPSLRRILPGARPQQAAPLPPEEYGGVARVVIEYVGNTSRPEPWGPGGAERRRNRAARVLMDYVRGQSLAREVSNPEMEKLLEELRHAIRSAEQVE